MYKVLGLMPGTSYTSTQEVEARRTGVQSHLPLHRKFEACLGYMRLCLKEKQDYKVMG